MEVGRGEEQVIEALLTREGRHVAEGIKDGLAVFPIKGHGSDRKAGGMMSGIKEEYRVVVRIEGAVACVLRDPGECGAVAGEHCAMLPGNSWNMAPAFVTMPNPARVAAPAIMHAATARFAAPCLHAPRITH